MDPLSLSGAFATIVGLLVSFKGERSGSDLTEFMAWLKENYHQEIAEAISQSSALSNELASLLTTNHDELLFRLNAINEQISQIVNRFEGFSGLTSLLSSNSVLSEQAKSVLEQIIKSKASMVMVHELGPTKPSQFLLIGGPGGEIQYNEPLFIDEDFETLVNSNLLGICK